METLKVDELKLAIESGSNKLFNNKERIDALNIFPVPDGDTGSNMSSTFQKAVKLLENNKYKKVCDLINDVSKNMLLSARGNSGVILSQIFKGLAIAWSKKSELSIKDIIDGFVSASKNAYSSVLKPVEGTILTVIRETSEELSKFKITNKTKIKKVFEVAVTAAKKSLNNTPNLLPVLKEVGVVDSGGEGLVMILEGFKSYFDGNFVEVDLNNTKPFSVVSNTEVYSGEFGYCTELIIKINDIKKFVKDKFVKEIEKLGGTSMVVVNDGDVLKIHVHIEKPGNVLNAGQKLGEFVSVKVENMTEQANTTKSNIEGIKSYEKEEVKPKKKNAIISCNSGSGFVEYMKELECDYVIDGGKSNNPSAQDIIEAINIVNAKNIIILPNNSNVILAAQQAAKIKSDKNIQIIPTKSQVEGITAMMNFAHDLDIKDNTKEIKESLKNLVVGEIAECARDTKINGFKVKKGNYLTILNHKIVGDKKDAISASKALVDKMIKSKKLPQLLVIYYGNNTSEIQAKQIEKYVLSKYDVEVLVQNGNQTLYDFMFGLE